ncbi:MAG: hypothetical protein ACREEE_12875 [Dongiaceae bacterium]
MKPVINLDELEFQSHADGPFQGRYGVIACPPGGRDVAHQIVNTGETDLVYLALSTMEQAEICEYPDSNKVGVAVGAQGNRVLRLIFRADQAVDYFDGATK